MYVNCWQSFSGSEKGHIARDLPQFVVLRHQQVLPSFKTMSVVKIVTDCLQLSDTETRDEEKNDVISDSEKPHIHFLGEQIYSKLDRVKTMVIRGKINAI